MSRIDAALRRAHESQHRDGGAAVCAPAGWQDLTPAIRPSGLEINQLPSEAASDIVTQPAAPPAFSESDVALNVFDLEEVPVGGSAAPRIAPADEPIVDTGAAVAVAPAAPVGRDVPDFDARGRAPEEDTPLADIRRRPGHRPVRRRFSEEIGRACV